MVVTLIQTAIILVWATVVLNQTRRLLRLAYIEPGHTSFRRAHIRQRLDRMWWWLGREEFWNNAQSDTLYGVQITLMLLLGWTF